MVNPSMKMAIPLLSLLLCHGGCCGPMANSIARVKKVMLAKNKNKNNRGLRIKQQREHCPWKRAFYMKRKKKIIIIVIQESYLKSLWT